MQRKRRPITDNAVTNSFRVGVRRPFSIRFWRKIRAILGVDSPQSLANAFDLAREQVSKGIDHGAFSLETMVVVQTYFDWQRTELQLPDHPPVKDRVVAGYQEAIHKIRTGRPSTHNDTLITKEELLSVIALLSDVFYKHKMVLGELDSDVWANILERVLPFAAELLDTEVDKLPFTEVSQFEFLGRVWGDDVCRVMLSVPYKWKSLTEQEGDGSGRSSS